VTRFSTNGPTRACARGGLTFFAVTMCHPISTAPRARRQALRAPLARELLGRGHAPRCLARLGVSDRLCTRGPHRRLGRDNSSATGARGVGVNDRAVTGGRSHARRDWPPHSITSSARASKVGGTDRLSALAVLRLMTRWNVVGCWTGRLEGLAPFRIISTRSLLSDGDRRQ
jgi:hypothetical protein